MHEGENSLEDGEQDEARSPLLADDEFYRALAARPRRRVLSYLLEQDETTVEKLAEVLCGWETTDEGMVSPERHKQVKIALEHVHIPVLADAGLVTHDRGTGRVALSSLDTRVRRLVRRGIEAERP